MRLVTFDDGSGSAGGVLLDEEIVPLGEIEPRLSGVQEALTALGVDALPELGRRAEGVGRRVPLSAVALGPPVSNPQKVICIGLNYRDHARESGQEIPTAVIWFAKFANSLVGTGADVILPSGNPDAVDYEGELAVVIGRPAYRVGPGDALGHVAGAMAFNDVSARDLQFMTSQWGAGKAIDTFAPCGPALVTLDEVGDLQQLAVRTWVNGELVQDGSTADQIFPVAEIVSWLSRTMTLLPGDVIATGTPAGVGAARGVFLRDGDSVEVEIERVGRIANRVRRPSDGV